MTTEVAWFRKDEKEAGESLSQIVSHYWEMEGRQRREIANLALALFTGNMKYSLAGNATILSVIDSLLQDPAAYNLIQASVGTLLANLFSNRVRPLFVTERGNYDLRERAQGMQDVTEGDFYEQEIYGMLGLSVCMYGLLFEGGGVEWYPDVANERVVATLCQPWEYFASKREARSLRPRQRFARHTVDRGELLAYYADADAETRQRIEDAPPAKHDDVDYDSYRDGSISDMVVVCKGWHLPSGRVDLSDERSWGRGKDGRTVSAGHDGRHVCTLEDGFVLVDRAWPLDFFPQAWFLPHPIPGSAWSRGLPEILSPVQLTMNKWSERIDRILDRHARPLIVTYKGAKIQPSRITNELASILESAVPPGQAIQYLQSPGVPPELVQRFAQLRTDGRDQIGLSELSMAAQRPQGLTSAPPMRHLKDEQSLRLTVQYRAWERFHLDSARCNIWCHREIAQFSEDHEVIFANAKELNRIPWAKINLEDDRFRLKAKPTNLFASDPEARANWMLELAQAGGIDQTRALMNMDNPDAEALLGDQLAPEKAIEQALDKVIKASEYDEDLMPKPYFDIELARRLVARRMNRLDADGESQDKIDRMLKFEQDLDVIAALRQRQQQQAAARAAQMTAPAGAPSSGGAPAMPPPGAAPPGPPQMSQPPAAPAGVPMQ